MAAEAVPDKFWSKWYHADDLERLELVEKLTGMEDHTTAVLTNSYLIDLTSYLEEELEKGGENHGS